MTGDVISLYRAELRNAAVRTAKADERRRRRVVVLAVALAAFFIVGGAIAAQSRWLSSRPIEVRLTAAGRAAALGYAECLAGHDLQSAAATSACGPVLGTIATTCLVMRSIDRRVVVSRTAACLTAPQRGIAVAH